MQTLDFYMRLADIFPSLALKLVEFLAMIIDMVMRANDTKAKKTAGRYKPRA